MKTLMIISLFVLSTMAMAKTTSKKDFVFKKSEEKVVIVKNEVSTEVNFIDRWSQKIQDKNVSVGLVHQNFSDKAFGSMNGLRVAGEFDFAYEALKKIDSRLSSSWIPYFTYTSNTNEENLVDVIKVNTKSNYWETGLAKSLMMSFDVEGVKVQPYASLGLGVARYSVEASALGQTLSENVTGLATSLEIGAKTEINKSLSIGASAGTTFFKGSSNKLASNNLSSSKLYLGINYHF